MTVDTRSVIDFRTTPERYRHWRMEIEGRVATLTMDVDESGGLSAGYALKLNSYDLGVDIELHDAVQRLRFEHPEVGAVVVAGAKDKVFCAGANIGMLARADHVHKVNFCKFTNETRLAIEDASANSGQVYLSALNGTAAGGGYEIALATEYIVLVDDGSSAVGLPEVPLLGVLPGTGGLTRLTDKRKIRRDLADVLATRPEGVKGTQALEWGLVDEIVPRSRLAEVAGERARELAERSDRPTDGRGICLEPIERELGDEIRYSHVRAALDRDARTASITIRGPEGDQPADGDAIRELGGSYWPLAVARELDDLVLHLRFNEPELGTLVLRTEGDAAAVAEVDDVLLRNADDWLAREIVLNLKRVLKRLDVTSRTLIALIEPGSCFAGTLYELALCADRSYMLDEGTSVLLTPMNFGPLPMGNGLTRLETRFWGSEEPVVSLSRRRGEPLEAKAAADAGLVTFVYDDIDWDDEIRVALEELASFSPDALSAMEANLRFAGPETLETKIFGRLSAWQNWVFSRPNATGEQGALPRYGTGQRATFDLRRV
ncbi:MAG: 2,3-epoxybenzoyl-CoA dihydrolase [Actinomycetota bacterium]